MEITLRPWRLEDIPELSRQLNNIHIWNHVRDGLPFPYTEVDAEEFITGTLENHGEPLDFSIRANGKLVGGIGIVPKEDVERVSAEIGYWIGEAYWGKGIATVAVRQLVDYAFQKLPYTRLYAGVFAFNPASMRVLEKAGFEQEGVFRRAIIKNGVITDFHQYGCVKS